MRVLVVNTSLSVPYWSYGDHWVDAFEDAGHDVSVWPYAEVASIPPGYDLYFFMEVRYPLDAVPAHCHPSVVFSFDAHGTGVYPWRVAAQVFDFVAIASKREAVMLSEEIGRRCLWVPEAYNARIHRYLTPIEDRTVQVGYVGNPDGRFPRNGITKDTFRQFIRSQYKDRAFDLKHQQGPHANVFGAAYGQLLNHIVLNVDWPIFHNLGTRVFESMACGCALLRMEISDDCGIRDIFTANEHYIPYQPSFESFREAVDMALADDARIAKEVAARGRDKVLEGHSYADRASAIIRHVLQK